MTRLVVLISGRGSNMQAVAQACESGDIDAELVLVISNTAKAAGLQFAREHGIDTAICDHTDYANREAFDTALAEKVKNAAADWVILAGFMRVLSPTFVTPFVGRLINIHPSLLPKYPGLNTHERVLAAGDTEHGATVHFVTPELDAGPIINQFTIPVHANDTSDTLAVRVLEREHGLLVKAVQRCVTGEVRFPPPTERNNV